MSPEAMKQAIDALNEAVAFREGGRQKAIDAISALRTALSQQPDNTSCKSVQKRLEAQQPATGEPMQADSSEHLRVIASLGAALRRLSFAAQTTGGTDGPDAELQSAIGQAEQALSLGGIWQAMSATAEPVVSRNPFASRCYTMSESHLSGHRLIVGFEKLGDVQDAHEWVARQGRGDFTRPAPSVPDDVVRDAERYRWLRSLEHCNEAWCLIGSGNANSNLDAAIDAAMLAAKEGGAA